MGLGQQVELETYLTWLDRTLGLPLESRRALRAGMLSGTSQIEDGDKKDGGPEEAPISFLAFLLAILSS